MGTTRLGLDAPMTTVGRCAPHGPDAAEGFRLVDRGNDYVVEVEGTRERVREIADHAARAVGLYTNRRPGVRLFLELSTAHLPAGLRDKSDINALDGVVAEDRSHGFMVWVPEDPRAHIADYEPLPEAVMAIQLYARECGCDWIMFDRDAAPVTCLPTFKEDDGKWAGHTAATSDD